MQVGIIALSGLFLLAGCDGDSADGGDGKQPFGVVSEASTSTYEAVVSGGATQQFSGGREGTLTIAGIEYGAWAVGAFAPGAPARGAHAWMNWEPHKEVITVAGGETFWPENGVVPEGVPFVSGTFDTPIEVDLLPPIGVPQQLPVKVEVKVGDPSAPTSVVPVDAVATYTLVAVDVVAETRAGPISGCRTYTGSVDVMGTTRHANATYHPELGLIAGGFDHPPPDGFSIDLLGILDYGTAASGMNVIKGTGVISSSQPTFRLDTYDRAGEFDADKTVHSKMLLELRWVDEGKAKTSDFPATLAPDFGTVFGTFPAQFVPSPLSLFHPGDNGRGFTFWYAFVDEAAKNEPGGNAIAYHAGVTLPDYVSSPMRVTGRIIYALVAP